MKTNLSNVIKLLRSSSGYVIIQWLRPAMDVMRLLTKKLKSQSLEDHDDDLQQETVALDRNTSATQALPDCDSGTASDEDVRGFNNESGLNGSLWRVNENVVRTTPMQSGNADHFSNQLATSFDNRYPCSISPGRVPSSPGAVATQTASDAPGTAARAVLPGSAPSGRLSAVSSDFERCSLDFEPSSSSEMECHTSEDDEDFYGEDEQDEEEEELATIYREDKRKRRERSEDSRSCSSSGDDRRSDEERFQQQQHQQQQPCDRGAVGTGYDGPGLCLDCRHPGNGGTPVSCVCGSGQVVTSSCGFSSPRKRRHRLSTSGSGSGAVAAQRPSLDLYKMQKTCIARKYNCNYFRPRAVKIRQTISGLTRPTCFGAGNRRTRPSPSEFRFRSISLASSRPNNSEEPFSFF